MIGSRKAWDVQILIQKLKKSKSGAENNLREVGKVIQALNHLLQ